MGSSPRRLSQGLRPSAGGTCRRGTVSRRPIALVRFRHVVIVPCCAYVVDWGSLAVAVRELGRALPASRRKAAAVRAGAPHTRLQCFTMRQTVAWTTIQRGVGRSGVASCGSLPCLWMSGCPAMCGRYVGSCLPRLPEFRLVCSSCATVCSPFPARSAIFLLDAHVLGSLVALSGGGGGRRLVHSLVQPPMCIVISALGPRSARHPMAIWSLSTLAPRFPPARGQPTRALRWLRRRSECQAGRLYGRVPI